MALLSGLLCCNTSGVGKPRDTQSSSAFGSLFRSRLLGGVPLALIELPSTQFDFIVKGNIDHVSALVTVSFSGIMGTGTAFDVDKMQSKRGYLAECPVPSFLMRQ